MVTNKNVVSDEKKVAATSSRGESETVLRPAVDVYEDATGITLYADMPGVTKDKLNVEVEGDTLAITGDLSLTAPESMQALYADIRSTRYRRSFTMSDELDREHIEALLKNGVLRLHIPKREEVRPRKIEVRVD